MRDYAVMLIASLLFILLVLLFDRGGLPVVGF